MSYAIEVLRKHLAYLDAEIQTENEAVDVCTRRLGESRRHVSLYLEKKLVVQRALSTLLLVDT